MRALVQRSFYRVQRHAARTHVRLAKPAHGASTNVPLFVLHSVANAASDMAVSPARLREQLHALADAGYRCVDFGDVLNAATTGQRLPYPAFALTFDDGYANVFENALPILQECNATATL